MNNLEQKNAIYGIYPKNVLPYGKADDVTLNAESPKSSSVNAIFRQLTDNDGFLERQIQLRAERQSGPRRHSDLSRLQGLPNGTKVIDDTNSDQLRMLKKVDDTPQKSLTRAMRGDFAVNFMESAWNGVVVGTSDGLFFSSDGENFAPIPLPDEDEGRFTGRQLESSAYDGDDGEYEPEDEDGLFNQFNATAFYQYGSVAIVGMGFSIYTVRRTVEFGEASWLVERASQGSLGGYPRAIQYLPVARMLYVATDRRLAKARLATISDIYTRPLRFSQVQERDGGSAISPETHLFATLRPLGESRETDLLVGTSVGLLSAFEEDGGLVGHTLYLDGEATYFVDRVGGQFAIGAEDGLYDSNEARLMPFAASFRAYAKSGDTRFYCVNGNVISAHLTETDGVVSADYQAFDFTAALRQDGYATEMFTLPITNDSNRSEQLVMMHLDDGSLYSFLPSQLTLRNVVLSGIDEMHSGSGGVAFARSGNAVSSLQFPRYQFEDDWKVLSAYQFGEVILSDYSIVPYAGDALEVIQDGNNVIVLEPKRILAGRVP